MVTDSFQANTLLYNMYIHTLLYNMHIHTLLYSMYIHTLYNYNVLVNSKCTVTYIVNRKPISAHSMF